MWGSGDRKHRPLGTWGPLSVTRTDTDLRRPDACPAHCRPTERPGGPRSGHPSTDESQRCRERLLSTCYMPTHSDFPLESCFLSELRSEPQSLVPTSGPMHPLVFLSGACSPLRAPQGWIQYTLRFQKGLPCPISLDPCFISLQHLALLF